MQRADFILNGTCEVYSSLKETTGTFEAFKKKKTFTSCENESYLVSRNRKKKHPADGSTTEISRENFVKIFVEYL